VVSVSAFAPFRAKATWFDAGWYRPVFVLPVKFNEGAAAEPELIVSDVTVPPEALDEL
jgi:hypothetical protein